MGGRGASSGQYKGRFSDGTDEQLQQAKRNLEYYIESLTKTVEGQKYNNKIAPGQFTEQLKINQNSLKGVKAQYEELKREFKKREKIKKYKEKAQKATNTVDKAWYLRQARLIELGKKK